MPVTDTGTRNRLDRRKVMVRHGTTCLDSDRGLVPRVLRDSTYDQLAEHLLRLLGIPRAEAKRLAAAALPELTEQ